MTEGKPGTPFASRTGQGDDTVVLLHGFGGIHHAWDGIVARLAPSAAVLAYDLPGHGRSLGVPTRGAADMAAAVLADLDARGVGRFRLCGHSLGGAVATLIAAKAPDRVDSVLLLAPGGYGPDIAGTALHRFAAAITPSELKEALRAMHAPGTAISNDALGPLAEARARPGQTQRLLELAGRIARDGRQGMFPTEMLESLSMPVAVLWGRRDPVLSFSHTANLPARFELHALDAAGHMLIEEAPLEVVRRLLPGQPA